MNSGNAIPHALFTKTYDSRHCRALQFRTSCFFVCSLCLEIQGLALHGLPVDGYEPAQIQCSTGLHARIDPVLVPPDPGGTGSLRHDFPSLVFHETLSPDASPCLFEPAAQNQCLCKTATSYLGNTFCLHHHTLRLALIGSHLCQSHDECRRWWFRQIERDARTKMA